MQTGKIVAGVVLAGVLIGFKFYHKDEAFEQTKAHLVEVCDGDGECVQAVETYYEGCFDESYSMGGRRRSASLDAAGLVQCLNTRSGVPHFEMNP